MKQRRGTALEIKFEFVEMSGMDVALFDLLVLWPRFGVKSGML